MALQFGFNKKDAEMRFRKTHLNVGKKLIINFMYSDPPFKVYEIEVIPWKNKKPSKRAR